jgi:hypothetical protein
MARVPWKRFLKRFSRVVLADEHIRGRLPTEVVESGWLGFPPATEDEIEGLEERLNARLPPSYRSFLKTSNGWLYPGSFIYDLLPTSKVGWLRDLHPDWIDAWMEGAKMIGDVAPISDAEYFVYGPQQDACNFRIEYWRATLTLSGRGDSSVFLLNPLVRTPEGEWEAWFFANWQAGAVRYRSFWELMQATFEGFVELRQGRAESTDGE